MRITIALILLTLLGRAGADEPIPCTPSSDGKHKICRTNKPGRDGYYTTMIVANREGGGDVDKMTCRPNFGDADCRELASAFPSAGRALFGCRRASTMSEPSEVVAFLEQSDTGPYCISKTPIECPSGEEFSDRAAGCIRKRASCDPLKSAYAQFRKQVCHLTSTPVFGARHERLDPKETACIDRFRRPGSYSVSDFRICLEHIEYAFAGTFCNPSCTRKWSSCGETCHDQCCGWRREH